VPVVQVHLERRTGWGLSKLDNRHSCPPQAQWSEGGWHRHGPKEFTVAMYMREV